MTPSAPDLYEDRQEPREQRAAWRRSRTWWLVAVLFTLANLVFTVVAAADGAVVHADLHGGLMFIGAYFVWRLAPRRVARY
jgi:hypothetical protein